MIALCPESSLERFIVTEATARAFEQATAFATEAVGAPRVLLLWGPPGVGKSHLLQSILRVVRTSDASARIVHVSAADFVQGLVDRLRNAPGARVRRPPRAPDILAVDDLHLLRDRPVTQRELAAAFKLVVDSGGRVACTAGCKPAEIHRLTSLLRELPQSRLVQLRAAGDAGMRHVVASLATSERLDLTPSALATISVASRGDVRRAVGALARLRFERDATGP